MIELRVFKGSQKEKRAFIKYSRPSTLKKFIDFKRVGTSTKRFHRKNKKVEFIFDAILFNSIVIIVVHIHI